MSYLLIPRLRIQHANAFVGRYAISPAQVMAMTLFAHNLARHVLPAGFDYSAVGVAIIHHDAQMLGEFTDDMHTRRADKKKKKETKEEDAQSRPKASPFHPQQRRAAVFIDAVDYASTNKYALSLQPVATCHLTVSLVLHLPGALSALKLGRFLQRARIAGGVVLSHGKPQIEAEWTALKLPRGYWIVDRGDLLQGDPLDAMIAALGSQAVKANAPIAAKDVAETGTEDAAKPDTAASADTDTLAESTLPTTWLAPAVLAYSAATVFVCRPGARMALGLDGAPDEIPPHAWGEPMLGLVQYVSLRRWASLPAVAPLPLWYPRWLRDDVFAVSMQPA